MSALIWAKCSKKLWANDYRHLIFRGGLDTFCSASATHADIWRRDTKREKCPACLKRIRALPSHKETDIPA